MYTILREKDGLVTFKTHVPMEDLSAEDARRILSGLSPVLETLRGLAARSLRAKPPRISGAGRPGSGRERPPDSPGGAAFDAGSVQRATARGENPAAEESAFDPVLEEDFSETFSDGTPSLGHFSLETVHALAGQEWYRRMGRTSAPDPVTRALIASLVVYALKPESPVRRRAAEWNLERLRKNLGANASAAGSACDRELCELSCALWHVLLTAGIPIERAVDLREAIDGILLEGVDRTAVTAFSPALGPLISSPVKSG